MRVSAVQDRLSTDDRADRAPELSLLEPDSDTKPSSIVTKSAGELLLLLELDWRVVKVEESLFNIVELLSTRDLVSEALSMTANCNEM